MSYSSLWVMDKNFNGKCLGEFGNSWLFAPVAWDILLNKYLPGKPWEDKRRFISATMFDDTLNGKLNEKINKSSIQEDRVLWELGNQQVFFTKDKEFVSNCIKNFLSVNAILATDLGEHIHERFTSVADSILSLNENDHPYFIMKNTSCDDNVEWWFDKYNEETEDNELRPLSEVDTLATEFVIVENNKISGFINNINYFKSEG